MLNDGTLGNGEVQNPTGRKSPLTLVRERSSSGDVPATISSASQKIDPLISTVLLDPNGAYQEAHRFFQDLEEAGDSFDVTTARDYLLQLLSRLNVQSRQALVESVTQGRGLEQRVMIDELILQTWLKVHELSCVSSVPTPENLRWVGAPPPQKNNLALSGALRR